MKALRVVSSTALKLSLHGGIILRNSDHFFSEVPTWLIINMPMLTKQRPIRTSIHTMIIITIRIPTARPNMLMGIPMRLSRTRTSMAMTIITCMTIDNRPYSETGGFHCRFF